MSKNLGRLLSIELVILFALAAGVAVFDASLELGDFHGLVFSLYLAYGSGLIFIANAIIAIAFLAKGNKGRAGDHFLAGLIVGLAGIGIAYLGGIVA